ncbi:hypothetical protein BDV59DRAFT_199357 [Aspergillus ambiguus]|uniref:uncharacterized protein n=1 Tax=Aspergillus ambiguus TaxID=176160 RepID=UPI003CCCC955
MGCSLSGQKKLVIRTKAGLRNLQRCDSCGKNAAKVAELSCKHHHCQHCLTREFGTAAKKMYYTAPQCCGMDISTGLAAPFLKKSLVARLEDKTAEMRDSNKTYCSNRSCGMYLPPGTFEGEVQEHTCDICVHTTCLKCKGSSHSGSCEICCRCLGPAHPFTCDDGTDDLLELADDKNWMQCPGCKIMVELVGDEYNMKCPCGTKFCYDCGQIRNTYHVHTKAWGDVEKEKLW